MKTLSLILAIISFIALVYSAYSALEKALMDNLSGTLFWIFMCLIGIYGCITNLKNYFEL